MRSEDLASIFKSPAFTIFVATICTIVLIHHVPVLVRNIRTLKDEISF